MSKFKEYLSDNFKDDLIGLPFFIGLVAVLLLSSPISWLVCFICLLLLSFVGGYAFDFDTSPFIPHIAWASAAICGIIYLIAFAFSTYAIFSRKPF